MGRRRSLSDRYFVSSRAFRVAGGRLPRRKKGRSERRRRELGCASQLFSARFERTSSFIGMMAPREQPSPRPLFLPPSPPQHKPVPRRGENLRAAFRPAGPLYPLFGRLAGQRAPSPSRIGRPRLRACPSSHPSGDPACACPTPCRAAAACVPEPGGSAPSLFSLHCPRARGAGSARRAGSPRRKRNEPLVPRPLPALALRPRRLASPFSSADPRFWRAARALLFCDLGGRCCCCFDDCAFCVALMQCSALRTSGLQLMLVLLKLVVAGSRQCEDGGIQRGLLAYMHRLQSTELYQLLPSVPIPPGLYPPAIL